MTNKAVNKNFNMIKKRLKRFFSINFILYILGRFKTIRFLYKTFNKVKSSKMLIEKSKISYIEPIIDKNLVLKDVQNEGLYNGLKLKDNILKKILKLSYNSKFVTTYDKKEFNSIDEINSFNLDNKKPYCLANLKNIELEILAQNISKDENLINLAKNYLGSVNKIDTKIQFSSVCEATDDWREQNEQTITFHYDVHHLNFLYIFFYITDCDKNSGAHEMVKGSHINKKFFKHLIGSARQNKKSLEFDYSKEKFINVEGKAGHGFIEDTSCFHRARIPINNGRIALHFRYY
jgi:hypothetical protein